MLRYLVLVAGLVFAGASGQAATYHFATDAADCAGSNDEGGYFYYTCQARMQVFVAPGDDGTSTNTHGALDIFRRGNRIGHAYFQWFPYDDEDFCDVHCAFASMDNEGNLTSLWWRNYGEGVSVEGDMNGYFFDNLYSLVSNDLIGGSGSWDVIGTSAVPVPVPLPATLPLIVLALLPLGISLRGQRT